jgi:hypothetical protein
MNEARMLPLSEILREDVTENELDAALGQLSEAERFAFDKALKSVGGVAQSALPGVVQGASQGAALGPYGMLVGGAIGGVQSALATGGKPPAAPRPKPPRPVAMPTSVAAAPPAPAQVPAIPSPVTQPLGANPAAQLLMAVQDPRTIQALAALVAGSAGRPEIPVGHTYAEPAAFINLLQTLAARTAATAPASGVESSHAYLRDDEGEYAWDVASPEARAQALLSHMQAAGSANSATPRGLSPGDWLLESGAAEVIQSF